MDKYHLDSCVKDDPRKSLVKIGKSSAEIMLTLSSCGWLWWWLVCRVIFVSVRLSFGEVLGLNNEK